MKKVFTKLAQSFQLVNFDGDGKCTAIPNTKQGYVNLRVEFFSSRNFAVLKCNIMRMLTQLGSAEEVLMLLDVLDSFTIEHNYLHEIRIHRQYLTLLATISGASWMEEIIIFQQSVVDCFNFPIASGIDPKHI